jgi:hypothetical protein
MGGLNKHHQNTLSFGLSVICLICLCLTWMAFVVRIWVRAKFKRPPLGIDDVFMLGAQVSRIQLPLFEPVLIC